MDILNFISWIKGGRQVTTVDASKTLIPLGLKDDRRDDGYLAGAITVEDLAAQLTPPAPEPTYKVYTALLTQSGGDEPKYTQSGGLDIGVTYRIDDNAGSPDFTNVGAPNNNVGTYFVATGTTPTSWGEAGLSYNSGAPVVTLLENTIGNIWFTYNNEGVYGINSGGLFFENKSWSINVLILQASVYSFLEWRNFNEFRIQTINGTLANDLLLNTPIEIRVYN
jgi:hypothetical protein